MTTITAIQAYEAMLEHNKRLGGELAGRADAVSALAPGTGFVRAGHGHGGGDSGHGRARPQPGQRLA